MDEPWTPWAETLVDMLRWMREAAEPECQECGGRHDGSGPRCAECRQELGEVD